ncbi:hypothetical protein QUF50_00700 [Thiotrichales bacterium HSG1]|nr:hypothetical protein [Thiotrichales bacterium HSG1]
MKSGCTSFTIIHSNSAISITIPTPEDFGLASEEIKNLQADDIVDLEPEIFATLNEEQLSELPIVALTELFPKHIANFNVEKFQKMPSEDISKLLVNLNPANIQPEDVAKLIPESWDFDLKTGKLTAPFGTKITPKTLPALDNMPIIPDMSSSFSLGGLGTPLMESTTESLAEEDLTDFVLSQEDSGILNVEGIGAEDGKLYTFIPDAENVIQVDTDKVPIGLSIGAGGFYTITTPDGLQYKVIPAPKDPVALSEAIGGDVKVGKSGDVLIKPAKKVRDARIFQVMMFDPFIEPAPESWCIFDDATGESLCDFDNAPIDMQPGIHFPRQRAKFKLPKAKVVYPDGSSQNVTPAVYSPETFLTEGLKFPGVEKITLNMNGTFYVLHEGREYIVASSFNVQTNNKVSPTEIKLNEKGGVSYVVPIKSTQQIRSAREVDMMLMFDLFIEPAPESWCVDNDGAIFCDFDNVPEFLR